jgi:hypothetical protein
MTAYAEMSVIARAVAMYQDHNYSLPAGPQPSAASRDYRNNDIIRQLQTVVKGQELTALKHVATDEAGSAVDPWGQPYRIVMAKSDTEGHIWMAVAVYSCGPNGIWEFGRGDDLGAGWQERD